MNETTPFWKEVRGSLMVRGNGWKPVIESLPGHISAAEAKELLQSPEQLACLVGQGHIAGILVTSSPDATILQVALGNGDNLPLENIFLQWLYRFVIVESLCEHNRKDALTGWNPMFLHLVDQGLHFMVYMAALLVLVEEGRITKAAYSIFERTEPLVKGRVAEACEFLHPKASDYGESFRRNGLPGLLPRLWDKAARYAQLRAEDRPSNFEKKEDSARDLLGYSVIAWSLMLELPKEFREGYQPVRTVEIVR
jgi:hypothetical protein